MLFYVFSLYQMIHLGMFTIATVFFAIMDTLWAENSYLCW